MANVEPDRNTMLNNLIASTLRGASEIKEVNIETEFYDYCGEFGIVERRPTEYRIMTVRFKKRKPVEKQPCPKCKIWELRNSKMDDLGELLCDNLGLAPYKHCPDCGRELNGGK